MLLFHFLNVIRDSSEIRLSLSQKKVFAGWKRPTEVLHRRRLAGDVQDAVRDPTMVAQRAIDLVQDVTADCSVVASLCAAVARTGDGFEKVNHLQAHLIYESG